MINQQNKEQNYNFGSGTVLCGRRTVKKLPQKMISSLCFIPSVILKWIHILPQKIHTTTTEVCSLTATMK